MTVRAFVLSLASSLSLVACATFSPTAPSVPSPGEPTLAEVRTLALAPGRDAGLGAQVPSMAPSVKSLSAHTQFRREQRWADVVVLHGAAPAAASGRAARSPRSRWRSR